MKAIKAIHTYQRLRSQPLWRLLAATNAPEILGLLQSHLLEDDKRVPASILHERLERDLEDLRTTGVNMTQSAQRYTADWLADGYLERHFPAGSAEEVFELSASAESAIRLVMGLVDRRSLATESRLSVVIQQLVLLSEETDTNPETRIKVLREEKNRIEEELEKAEKGEIEFLDERQALERAREIISLADGLIGDFRQVRSQFETLNRSFRVKIMDEDENRGTILEDLFAGVDLIAESPEGRTFSAFWKLLTDIEQSAILEDAIEQILSREFSRSLQLTERQFLRRLTGALLKQGGDVHDVLQNFARSLKQFVQSREYLEQRKLHRSINEAQRSAVELKEQMKATDELEFILTLTSCKIKSLSQMRLYDPSLGTVDGTIHLADSGTIDLQTIASLVSQSEIDFRLLKNNIIAVLQDRQQASIREIMTEHPATQGLGTVVGYIALGCKYGITVEARETIEWESSDEKRRTATIPVIYFSRQRADELV